MDVGAEEGEKGRRKDDGRVDKLIYVCVKCCNGITSLVQMICTHSTLEIALLGISAKMAALHI